MVPINAANIRQAQQQFEDELTVMYDLLETHNGSGGPEKVKEIQAIEDAYSTTFELQRELSHLLERIEKMGINLFVNSLSPEEKLTFEQLGFEVAVPPEIVPPAKPTTPAASMSGPSPPTSEDPPLDHKELAGEYSSDEQRILRGKSTKLSALNQGISDPKVAQAGGMAHSAPASKSVIGRDVQNINADLLLNTNSIGRKSTVEPLTAAVTFRTPGPEALLRNESAQILHKSKQQTAQIADGKTISHADDERPNEPSQNMQSGLDYFQKVVKSTSAAHLQRHKLHTPSFLTANTNAGESPITSSAFAVWEFLCRLQDPAHSGDRAEIFCVLFDAVDSDGSGTIPCHELESSILKIGADSVRERLLQNLPAVKSDGQIEENDSAARLLIGSAVGRLHIVCRCLCVPLMAGLLQGGPLGRKKRLGLGSKFGEWRASLLLSIMDHHASHEVYNWDQFCAMLDELFTEFLRPKEFDGDNSEYENDDIILTIAQSMFPYFEQNGKREDIENGQRKSEMRVQTNPMLLALVPSFSVTSSKNSYISIGDSHTSERLASVGSEESSRQNDVIRARLKECETKLMRQDECIQEAGDRIMKLEEMLEEKEIVISSLNSKVHDLEQENIEMSSLIADQKSRPDAESKINRADNEALQAMLKQARSEFKAQEDILRSEIFFLQKRFRQSQDRLRRIYGPRLSFALPRQKNQHLHSTEGDIASYLNIGAGGGPKSYGRSKNESLLLPGMNRWDSWLHDTAKDDTKFIANQCDSDSTLLKTPRFGGASMYDKDPLVCLVEDVVAQVQLKCPFRICLRRLVFRGKKLGDVGIDSASQNQCLYYMADRKLCVRLEKGIAVCAFASHTEPLKNYLEKLYSIFTNMPAEVMSLYHKMVADATESQQNSPGNSSTETKEDSQKSGRSPVNLSDSIMSATSDNSLLGSRATIRGSSKRTERTDHRYHESSTRRLSYGLRRKGKVPSKYRPMSHEADWGSGKSNDSPNQQTSIKSQHKSKLARRQRLLARDKRARRAMLRLHRKKYIQSESHGAKKMTGEHVLSRVLSESWK